MASAGVYQRDPLTDDVRAALSAWSRYLQLVVDVKLHTAHEKFLLQGDDDERARNLQHFRDCITSGGDRWLAYLGQLSGKQSPKPSAISPPNAAVGASENAAQGHPKVPPAGLGAKPRLKQEKADRALLLEAVEREFEARRRNRDNEETPVWANALKLISRHRAQAAVQPVTADPVTAKWVHAIRAAACGHPKLLIELSGDPGIVECIKVQQPKQRRGRPRSLPPWAVELAREVRSILRVWFTLDELKSWPSAAEIATVIVLNDVEPYLTLDDDLGDWPKQITKRMDRARD